MQASPLVSVILPTYNRAAVLDVALRSVLAQTMSDLELIIVDDGSTDTTDSLVSSYSDSRVRYIRLAGNSGCAVARNVGLQAAAGEWVAFQDSDDEWLPDKLESQLREMGSHNVDRPPQCAGTVCALVRHSQSGPELIAMPGSGGKVDVPEVIKGLHASLLGMLLRRSVVAELGGFDESLRSRSDLEFTLRLLQRFSLLRSTAVLVVSYESPGGVSADWANKRATTQAIMEKHLSLFSQHPVALGRVLYDLAKLDLLMGDLPLARQRSLRALRFTWTEVRSWMLCLGLWLAPGLALARLQRRFAGVMRQPG